jgi:hypothetical protein
MKIATILLSILDALATIVITAVIYKYSDAMFSGLDTFLIWAVPILCLVTAVPAFMLARRKLWPKPALALALAFPVGFLALVVGVFFYFTYAM